MVWKVPAKNNAIRLKGKEVTLLPRLKNAQSEDQSTHIIGVLYLFYFAILFQSGC